MMSILHPDSVQVLFAIKLFNIRKIASLKMFRGALSFVGKLLSLSILR